MRKHLFKALLPAAALLAGFLPFVPAKGQFPAESTIPKNQRKSRKIKMGPSGPVPRTADGKVDLSGVWGYANYTSDLAKDYSPDNPVPFTPLWTARIIPRT